MITGQIKKILTQKDNDWGRYVIDSLGRELLAVGIITNAAVGMTVVLEGKEVDNEYGHQFRISSVLSTQEDSLSGIRKFLSDGYVTGIGKAKANEIVSMFGSESISLFKSPEGIRKLMLVKGLGEASIKKAKESFDENSKYLDIVLFLNGSGTKNQVEAIYKKYGEGAIKVLKANPYRLQMDLDGYGFIKADNIAMASGIKPDSIYRLMAASKYAIEEAATKGNCYLTVDEIKEFVLNLLVPSPKCSDISEIVVNNALKAWPENKEKLIKAHNPSSETIITLSRAKESRSYIERTFSEALQQAISNRDLINDNGKIYTPKMYEVECRTAAMISEMCQMSPVRVISDSSIEDAIKAVEETKTRRLKEDGIDAEFIATKEQRKAVYLALKNKLCIISGGPGRGKTAISEIVAHGFLSAGRYYSTDDIIMLAPTGRAAQRITESTGYSAMTAHRAIILAKNGEYPKNKLILVDEFSMADIFLTMKILELAKDCNLVLVGDVDQIASVGPGKVLRDMIDSGTVPYILLKQGHRNSGTIASNSELIKNGVKIGKYTYDSHFVYIPATADTIADVIVADYIKKVDEFGIKDVMLCTAMRNRGSCSVNKLNTMLQDVYTKGKPEARFGDRIFRVGDRVMQTTNDYEFITVNQGTQRSGIFNGERGSVIKVIYDPLEQGYRMVVLFDDGSLGGYTSNTAQNLTLAYATTLHKCQGSEAKCMMMAYTFADYMLLNRALFYTGETRSKKEFRFYGEEKLKYGKMMSAFDIAVSKIDDEKRNTSLRDRLVS